MGRVAQWLEAHVVLSLAMPSIAPKPERLAWPGLASAQYWVEYRSRDCAVYNEDDIIKGLFLGLGLQHRKFSGTPPSSLLPSPSGPITLERSRSSCHYPQFL